MSVADQLRKEQQHVGAQRTVEERIVQALALGKRDQELHAATHHLDLITARNTLRRQRGLGRVASRSASG